MESRQATGLVFVAAALVLLSASGAAAPSGKKVLALPGSRTAVVLALPQGSSTALPAKSATNPTSDKQADDASAHRAVSSNAVRDPAASGAASTPTLYCDASPSSSGSVNLGAAPTCSSATIIPGTAPAVARDTVYRDAPPASTGVTVVPAGTAPAVARDTVYRDAPPASTGVTVVPGTAPAVARDTVCRDAPPTSSCVTVISGAAPAIAPDTVSVAAPPTSFDAVVPGAAPVPSIASPVVSDGTCDPPRRGSSTAASGSSTSTVSDDSGTPRSSAEAAAAPKVASAIPATTAEGSCCCNCSAGRPHPMVIKMCKFFKLLEAIGAIRQ